MPILLKVTMIAPLPSNESERLQALHDYEILDTEPEPSFDEITTLAADVSGCPVATISLIDQDRQWYKSRLGLDIKETPRRDAFCAHTILEEKMVVVPDATKDPRFADNPYVLGDPKVRFYAGLPLVSPGGFAVGTLCVVDLKPRELTPDQRRALDSLARHVVTMLELRRALMARHRAETEVLRLNEGLEQRVVERTSQLNEANRILQAEMTEREGLQRQMVQIQKMEAIGRLAGGIAHDFNNILLVINGYCDLLFKEGQVSETSRTYITEIQKAGERGSGLTRQLLAFSRQQVIEPKVLDLNSVVDNMQGMLLRLIGADIRFTLEKGVDLLPVRADQSQIEQVIMNLVINARDAMDHGGRLVLRTSSVAVGKPHSLATGKVPPDDYTVISLEDSGGGMSEEIKRRLFEPFFTTKSKGHGTGLGLATCYGIVKQNGGFIIFDTELGRGTVFHVYLPGIRDGKLSSDSAALPPIARGQESILLVEDDRAVRELTTLMLRGFGYTVYQAQDGLEALALIESRKSLQIDLIVSDIVMPNMNGRELIEAAAKLRPGIASLLLSGHTDDELVHRGVLNAHTSFLQKPFRPHHLAKAVRDALTKQAEAARHA
jgi:signal transduction histidine kinase/ActR/RegA family two-component response regulator